MARQKSESADFIPFPTRFPKDMLDTIKALAADGRRPINNQILMLLEHALAHSEQPKPAKKRAGRPAKA